MENKSLGKASKDKEPQKMTGKKLDFLLDTIDTEIADLADVVESEGPILADETSSGVVSAVALNDEKISIAELDLDTELFDDLPEPQAQPEAAEGQAKVTLDALSDAEGEVEAMLAEEGVASDTGKPTAKASNIDPVNQDAAKALEELLSTREVDASKLIEEEAEQKDTSDNTKNDSEGPPAIDDQLSEDLFDDLGIGLESGDEDSGVEGPPAIDDQLSEDLLDDLKMEFESGEDGATPAESTVVEDDPAEALFAELESRSADEGKEVGAGEESTPSSADEQLGALMTKKIETLVNRLVEERLSAIAERIITEKLNKIIASMK